MTQGRRALRCGGAIGYGVGATGRSLGCMLHLMNEAHIQVGLGAAMLGMAGISNRATMRISASRAGRCCQPQLRAKMRRSRRRAVGGTSRTYLRAMGHAVLGRAWLDVAGAALRLGDAHRCNTVVVAGKLAAARYFIGHELPLVDV